MSDFNITKFSQNEEIFKEGSIGIVAYILRTGKVEISVKIGDEKKVLSVIEPTNVFGEIALLSNDHKRIASATALEYTEVIEIDSATFNDYITKSPQMISMLLKALVERLKKTTMIALKVPDIFSGICAILHLMAIHGTLELHYDDTITTISKALSGDKEEIKAKIEVLKTFNLVEIKESGKNKIIKLTQKDDFLQKAFKLQQALLNLG